SHQPGQAHLAVGRDAEGAAQGDRVGCGFHERGMGVAGYQRAKGSYPVHVLAAAIVPDVAALTADERGRVPAHRPVGPYRAVDATREEFDRLRDHAGTPSMDRISCSGRCTQVRIGVSRTVERRLSVPRRSRTRLLKATRSSVSYATRKSWSSMPNEEARRCRTCVYS